MNGLGFTCCALNNWNAYWGEGGSLVPSAGFWGDWTNTVFVIGDYLKGGNQRIERPGDDPDDLTGINAIKLISASGGSLTPHPGHFGGWYDGDVYCPGASLITGISLKVQSSQAGGDDVAMNAIRWQCSCPTNMYPSCDATSCTCLDFTTCLAGQEETKAPTSFCALGITGCNRVCASCVFGLTYSDSPGSLDCQP